MVVVVVVEVVVPSGRERRLVLVHEQSQLQSTLLEGIEVAEMPLRLLNLQTRFLSGGVEQVQGHWQILSTYVEFELDSVLFLG